jgi:hypothetical protein
LAKEFRNGKGELGFTGELPSSQFFPTNDLKGGSRRRVPCMQMRLDAKARSPLWGIQIVPAVERYTVRGTHLRCIFSGSNQQHDGENRQGRMARALGILRDCTETIPLQAT